MYARAHRHFCHAAAAGRTHEWTRDSIYERVRFARHRSAFIAVSAVMGRRGKVRCFRNPWVLSLLLSCARRRVAGSSYLPDSDYIAPRRDMYRPAKLFSNSRLFGAHSGVTEVGEEEHAEKELSSFSSSTADISPSCKQTWKRGRRKCLRTPTYPRSKHARRANR